MKTKETSVRQQALEWWGNLSISEKSIIGASTASLRKFDGRTWQNFTGREIEEIWRKETKDGSDREIIEEVFPDLKESLEEHLSYSKFHKPNQKQFKDFDSELFKAYINKFNKADRIKAILEIVYTLSYNEVKFVLALINDVQNERM